MHHLTIYLTLLLCLTSCHLHRHAAQPMPMQQQGLIADFVYTDNASGQTVVEDTKGVRTKEYIIKRKLMLHVHNIQIHEI